MLSAEAKRVREVQRDSSKFQEVRALVLVERRRLADVYCVPPFDYLPENHTVIRAVLAYHKEYKQLPQVPLVEAKLVSNFFRLQPTRRLEVARFRPRSCLVRVIPSWVGAVCG